MIRFSCRPSAVAGVAILVASCLSASSAVARKAAHADVPGLVCPVTHLAIASPAVAVGRSVYKGKTYYFCTSNCKRLFDAHPAKYAKAH